MDGAVARALKAAATKAATPAVESDSQFTEPNAWTNYKVPEDTGLLSEKLWRGACNPAAYASLFLLVLGIVFMGKCKTMWHELIQKPGWSDLDRSRKEFIWMGALASHMWFIIGVFSWLLGCANLLNMQGFTLFPTEFYSGELFNVAMLATPVQTAITSILVWMNLAQRSIIGVPGITGPPVPIAVILTLITILLNTVVVSRTVFDFQTDSVVDEQLYMYYLYFVLYGVTVGVPHLIGLKHRVHHAARTKSGELSGILGGVQFPGDPVQSEMGMGLLAAR